jgi:hypothetical protein
MQNETFYGVCFTRGVPLLKVVTCLGVSRAIKERGTSSGISNPQ